MNMQALRPKWFWYLLWFVTILGWPLPNRLIAQAATYTVNTTNDVNDGTCDMAHCSLREAILAANTNSTADTIAFNIPGGGVHIIQPLTALPALSSGNVTIDGYTQPGSSPPVGGTKATILIEIDGTNTTNQSGLYIISANNVVRGLAINRFDLDGIGIGGTTATGNVIAGNHIGCDVDGTIDRGNGHSGVFVGYGAMNNTIGGDEPAERNVLSGNEWSGVEIHGNDTANNIISGNYIGTQASGTIALGNTLYGVRLYGGAYSNTIGGNAFGERNIISANGNHGVIITGQSRENLVVGNYIGSDVTGANDLGNTYNGVFIAGMATGNTVGGESESARNIISGNDDHGVSILGTSTISNTVVGNYIGVDQAGTSGLGNANCGVIVSAGAQNTRIDRNVLSANLVGVCLMDVNTMNNTVTGNLIGTNATGNARLGNRSSGVNISAAASNNLIGGDTSQARNIISGNETGIRVEGASGNTLTGNYIGIDIGGELELGNDRYGIILSDGSQNNIVGGSTLGEGNVISANGRDGIYVSSSTTTGNVILGNHIGTDAGGTADLGNGQQGIELDVGARSNTIGPGNVIAYNDWQGILVDSDTTIGNVITQNRIFANTGLDIELAVGAHGGITAPLITSTGLGVHIKGTACAGCTVEVFANSDDDGEGEFYLGSTVADGSGNFDLLADIVPLPYLTATATDVTLGTSQFSATFVSTIRYLYFPLTVR